MSVNNWKYYNHALIPVCAPHEVPDIDALNSDEVWKTEKGNALLARYTTDWDCDRKTSWWYVIKDTTFDISKLKAKRRYEINKGIKNFDVKRIIAKEYSEELFLITTNAWEQYPKKYRPTVKHDEFVKNVEKWDKYLVYGVFSKEDNKIVGFAWLNDCDSFIDFAQLKVLPQYEKKGVNAGLVYGILEDLKARIENGCYICDGSRSIVHETAFQNYLEKYFGFRKAYCKLHIKYKGVIRYVVLLLYPFRDILKYFDNIPFLNKVNSLLLMESIARE